MVFYEWESAKHVVIPDPRRYAGAVNPVRGYQHLVIGLLSLFLQNNYFIYGRVSGVIVN